MSDCRLHMLHNEKEMTDGHDVYNEPNISKVVVDQSQMIDLESRAFVHLDDVLEEKKKICVTLSLMSPDFKHIFTEKFSMERISD